LFHFLRFVSFIVVRHENFFCFSANILVFTTNPKKKIAKDIFFDIQNEALHTLNVGMSLKYISF